MRFKLSEFLLATDDFLLAVSPVAHSFKELLPERLFPLRTVNDQHWLLRRVSLKSVLECTLQRIWKREETVLATGI